MTNNTTKKWNRSKLVVSLYTGTVTIIFVALMVSLFKNREETSPSSFQIDDQEILAVIEEYREDSSSSVSIAVEDIEKILPKPQEPAWKVNAALQEVKVTAGHRFQVVVIIDDLGLSEEATTQLANMPGPYTLAYLPYADNLETQTATIRQAGHELMVHLPMQSHRETADPGDNALLTGLDFNEFARRVEWNLSRFDGFVGINNHMGSKITEDPTLMVRVMARLRQGGYLFVDSLTTPNSVGRRAANALGVPFVARDVFLDNEQDLSYINRQLATLERIARLRGYAIAIGHPYEETLSALATWRQTLDFKGIELVPVSRVMTDLVLKEAGAAQSR